jgi:L-threonylcarbamoyladenylate synthase
MARILIASESSICEANQLLSKGEVVAIPTETVYGLAANAYDKTAVEKIFTIKGRPSNNPLIVHIASVEDIGLVTTPEAKINISSYLSQLSTFIPGPLSLVVPKNERIPSIVSAGLSTVAVRIPKHSDTNKPNLCPACGRATWGPN